MLFMNNFKKWLKIDFEVHFRIWKFLSKMSKKHTYDMDWEWDRQLFEIRFDGTLNTPNTSVRQNVVCCHYNFVLSVVLPRVNKR